MSYCRFGSDSDIYCFYNVDGNYEVRVGDEEQQFKTPQETVNFLRSRKDAGDKVPDYAIEMLLKEKNT